MVAGASRGGGKGIALALGEAGATVYVVARSTRQSPAADAAGTIEDTAEEVTSRGGRGIAMEADLSDEQQAADVFARIERLDVVANSVWTAHFVSVWGQKFWTLEGHHWRAAVSSVSACWNVSVQAARKMTAAGGGLIVHVTDHLPDDPHGDRGQILQDFGHESVNRMIASMSRDTADAKVTVVGVNPGFMRTERVLAFLTTDTLKEQFGFARSESTEFLGRAVAALAADPKVSRKNGALLQAADLAEEYGFTDIDGRVPRFWPQAAQG